LNKQELINEIAVRTGFSKKDSEIFVGAFTGTIMDTVAKAEKVLLVGFGGWEKKETKGREGVFKAKKGEEKPWKTEDSFKPVFNPSKAFEDAVKA